MCGVIQSNYNIQDIVMEKPVLIEKDEFPTEKIIYGHIGDTRKYWDSLFVYLHTNYPDFTEEWRYYNDGKSWLMKVTRKSSTVFWLSVIENGFRITFYFGDKAAAIIAESSLSEHLKKQFSEGKRFGKIRGITIPVKDPNDLEDIKVLIGIKFRLK